MYGIRYVAVALGDVETPATEEDCETIKRFIESVSEGMLTGTVLSERVSKKVTLALLQERGVL